MNSNHHSNHHNGFFHLNTEQMYVASVIVTYWIVVVSIVMFYSIMSSGILPYRVPLFETWFQCVVTAFICWVAGTIGTATYKQHLDSQQLQQDNGNDNNEKEDLLNYGINKSIGNNNNNDNDSEMKKPNFWAQFPKAEYQVEQGQRVFPLSVVAVGLITLSTFFPQSSEVSFYHFTRPLIILFNTFLSTVMLGQKNSTTVLLCLGVVIFGFFVGNSDVLNFSLTGILYTVALSLFGSLHDIYTKKVLPVVDNDQWKLIFYYSVNTSILLFPLMIIFEHESLMAVLDEQFFSLSFWMAMLVSGVFWFLIVIVSVLQIKATSPLTHSISVTSNADVETLLASYIWKNPQTINELAGIFITLLGSLAYTWVKMNETSPLVSSSSSSSSQHKILQENDVEMKSIKPSK